MRRRAAALATCALLFADVHARDAVVVDADADPRLGQLMRQLAERTHGHAAFIERDDLAVLKRPLESSGELFYDAPDRLEKRTLAPRPESLLLDHGSVEIQRGTHHYTLSLHDTPAIAPFIDSMRATLAGDLPALERAYAVKFDSAGEDWTLELVPREANLAALFAVIRISGSRSDIRSVEVRRANGDRSLMTIHDLER
jgi:hypothetical protein